MRRFLIRSSFAFGFLDGDVHRIDICCRLPTGLSHLPTCRGSNRCDR